jgi:hypothetical protein
VVAVFGGVTMTLANDTAVAIRIAGRHGLALAKGKTIAAPVATIWKCSHT